MTQAEVVVRVHSGCPEGPLPQRETAELMPWAGQAPAPAPDPEPDTRRTSSGARPCSGARRRHRLELRHRKAAKAAR
ncbi:hypothetical protein [Georgenia yuyongxinii]